jgi:hypothetical protein
MALIAEARAAKVELSKALNDPKDAQNGNDEHLRRNWRSKSAEMLARAEDAHSSARDEHLRGRGRTAYGEDAHPPETMSTFDRSEDFRGFPSAPRSKMLIPPSLTTFKEAEHLHEPKSSLAAIVGQGGGASERSGVERKHASDAQWWRDQYEERATVQQYDGGYSRAQAERLAWGVAARPLAHDAWRAGAGPPVRRLSPADWGRRNARPHRWQPGP